MQLLAAENPLQFLEHLGFCLLPGGCITYDMRSWFRGIIKKIKKDDSSDDEDEKKPPDPPAQPPPRPAPVPQRSREPTRKSKEQVSTKRSAEKDSSKAKANSNKTNKSINRSASPKSKINQPSAPKQSIKSKIEQPANNRKEEGKSEVKSVVKSTANREEEDEKSRKEKSDKSKNKSLAKDKSVNKSKLLRSVAKMKVFVSRPITEDGMKKTREKVQNRKTHAAQTSMKEGDDAFPKRKPNPKEGRKVQQPSDVFADNLPDASKASKNVPVPLGKDNNNNEGTKEPFWMTDKDCSKEDTEDDLPLNAEIIEDVHEQRVTLVSMPSVPVVLDRFHTMDEMKKKDKLFFTKEVLFGNTVRTMININDISMRSKDEENKIKQLPFTNPTICHSYSHSNVKRSEQSQWEPSPRKERRKSRRN